jgi:hypothetical protein
VLVGCQHGLVRWGDSLAPVFGVSH